MVGREFIESAFKFFDRAFLFAQARLHIPAGDGKFYFRLNVVSRFRAQFELRVKLVRLTVIPGVRLNVGYRTKDIGIAAKFLNRVLPDRFGLLPLFEPRVGRAEFFERLNAFRIAKLFIERAF